MSLGDTLPARAKALLPSLGEAAGKGGNKASGHYDLESGWESRIGPSLGGGGPKCQVSIWLRETGPWRDWTVTPGAQEAGRKGGA